MFFKKLNIYLPWAIVSLCLLKYRIKVAMSAAFAPDLLKYFLAASARILNTTIFKTTIRTSASSKLWNYTDRFYVCCHCSSLFSRSSTFDLEFVCLVAIASAQNIQKVSKENEAWLMSVCFWLFVRIQSFFRTAQIYQPSQLCLSVSAQISKTSKGFEVASCLPPRACSKRPKLDLVTSNVCSSLTEALYIHRSPCQLYICRIFSKIFSKGFKKDGKYSKCLFSSVWSL